MGNDLFSVRDRVVVITGGLGQLGRQFTLALTERGAKVAIFDNQVDNQEARETLDDDDPSTTLLLPVDVTQRGPIEDGLRAINSKWGVPHALINNAALDSPPDSSARENGPLEDYPESSWDKVMQVNVKGAFLCSQVVGAQMAAAGCGSIVNICSIYGMVSPDHRIYEYRRASGKPFYKPVVYSASKSALLNLTRYMAAYWASQNVRVNTLTLGGVFNNQDEQFLKGYCSRVPMARMARHNEYNGAIVFLVSDASSYMTGSNLVIDGGYTAW